MHNGSISAHYTRTQKYPAETDVPFTAEAPALKTKAIAVADRPVHARCLTE